MEIKGIIYQIGATITHGANNFQKREIVIETLEQYPQKLKFEAAKAFCEQLDKYKVGQTITAHFNLRGNEYQGKFYVNLQVWKIEAEASQTVRTVQPVTVVPIPPVLDDDDLPF